MQIDNNARGAILVTSPARDRAQYGVYHGAAFTYEDPVGYAGGVGEEGRVGGVWEGKV